ncbi:hypothetical protein [Streptomyces lateritius]|uniref:hypothetical protein n=1 Tax=Streptomyces lateritius TaxID=67313 RepID=UPI00167B0A44|nr:hypothetical protein [Streptomyces lateritius]GGU14412.1 hypothetical protein GCM10010272_69320 [Streptomyces lateritius]
MAADFQNGQVPPGFAFDERGELIHYKYGLVVSVPQANQAGWAGEVWLSFGAAWGDAKIKVKWHNGSWSAPVDLTVTDAGGHVNAGAKFPAGTTKVAIGRVKKNANDTDDDIPVGWLLQVAEAA